MIFDVLKRSHGANKFTDNKFINGTHSTPVLTEYPTLRTWVTCVKINRSEVHPILTLVVKFKLYPTSVAQVHPPPLRRRHYMFSFVKQEKIRKKVLCGCGDGPGGSSPPPPPPLIFGPIRGTHRTKKNRNRPPLLSWSVDE